VVLRRLKYAFVDKSDVGRAHQEWRPYSHLDLVHVCSRAFGSGELLTLALLHNWWWPCGPVKLRGVDGWHSTLPFRSFFSLYSRNTEWGICPLLSL
jgi:hypothetical protein